MAEIILTETNSFNLKEEIVLLYMDYFVFIVIIRKIIKSY